MHLNLCGGRLPCLMPSLQIVCADIVNFVTFLFPKFLGWHSNFNSNAAVTFVLSLGSFHNCINFIFCSSCHFVIPMWSFCCQPHMVSVSPQGEQDPTKKLLNPQRACKFTCYCYTGIVLLVFKPVSLSWIGLLQMFKGMSTVSLACTWEPFRVLICIKTRKTSTPLSS